MNRLKRLLKNFNSISVVGFSDSLQPGSKSPSKKLRSLVTKQRGILLAVCLVLVAAIGAYSLLKPNEKVNELYPGATPSPKASPASSPEVLETSPLASPVASVSPKPKVSPSPSPTASPTSAPSPSPTPTIPPSPTPTIAPTPSPSPQPPVMNISFPTDGQTIVYTNPNQTLCMVDTPVSGTYGDGLKRKVSLNGGTWTEYVDMFTLCYQPKEGNNAIEAQYKNKYGLESVVYSMKFTVQYDFID